VPHVARDGLEGLTVEPGDERALGAAMSRLLDDPALAARLGYAGRSRARSKYDRKVFATSVIDIYREALTQRRPKP
jgi:rhamnosyl/mannosyltransferase